MRGVAAVHIATVMGYLGALRLFFQHNRQATLARCANLRFQPLHWAAAYNQYEALLLVLESLPQKTLPASQINRPGTFLLQPTGSECLVVDTVSEETGHDDFYVSYCTPLHIACLTRSVGCARVLLEQGANPNAKNCKSETPLMLVEKGDQSQTFHSAFPGAEHVDPADPQEIVAKKALYVLLKKAGALPGV